jgi:hypothetical protein
MLSKLGAKWYYATASHPQTDGASERMIQRIEIMLRHIITQGVPWLAALPAIISIVNSTPSWTTQATPHRLLFGIDVRTPWNALQKIF